MSNENSKSKPRKKHRCEITDRDYRLLRFLWRWKAVSTMALAKKFFPEAHIHTAYRRLIYLENDGYLQSSNLEKGWEQVWTIGAKGFKHIMPYLGELKQSGHKSEHFNHDHLATAFHLGEWLTQQPSNSENYSEQQLRRCSADVWPEWVPQSQTHRPDGYSIYMAKDKMVLAAFETELWSKTRRRYESLVAFYDSEVRIDYVFWLVSSKVVLKSLKKSFAKFNMRAIDKHHFVLLSDFKEKGWKAPFIEGHLKGLSLYDLLVPKPLSKPALPLLRSDTHDLLDTQKKPINSNTPETQNPAQNAD